MIALLQLGDALREQPLLALPTLFGAGLLTSLTPCVYPMIPITAAVIAGSAEKSFANARFCSRSRMLSGSHCCMRPWAWLPG